MHFYQVSGLQRGGEVIVWSSQRFASSDTPSAFFSAFAGAWAPHRQFFELADILWGYTQPSEYRRGRSAREIDPFSGQRLPYLFVYPFVKTKDWYLLPSEERRELMREHIRVGKEHSTITQLLLYSFGLQDHEFVVIYEAEDVRLFSNLVRDLRATEVRRFTERDTPLHVGIHREREALLALDG